MLLLISHQLFPAAAKNAAGHKLSEQNSISLAGHLRLLPTFQVQLAAHFYGNYNSSQIVYFPYNSY